LRSPASSSLIEDGKDMDTCHHQRNPFSISEPRSSRCSSPALSTFSSTRAFLGPSPSERAGTSNPDDDSEILMLALRAQTSIGGDNGLDDSSNHLTCASCSWWRRLLRPWTLVLIKESAFLRRRMTDCPREMRATRRPMYRVPSEATRKTKQEAPARF
jgi:hypothetical protein